MRHVTHELATYITIVIYPAKNLYSECHNNSTLLHGYYTYNDGKSGIDLIEKYDCHIFCKKSKKLRVLLAISQMKESCITHRRVIENICMSHVTHMSRPTYEYIVFMCTCMCMYVYTYM